MNRKLEAQYDEHLECQEDLQCLRILIQGSTDRSLVSKRLFHAWTVFTNDRVFMPGTCIIKGIFFMEFDFPIRAPDSGVLFWYLDPCPGCVSLMKIRFQFDEPAFGIGQ